MLGELMGFKVDSPKNPAPVAAIIPNCLLSPRHTESGTVRLPI